MFCIEILYTVERLVNDVDDVEDDDESILSCTVSCTKVTFDFRTSFFADFISFAGDFLAGGEPFFFFVGTFLAVVMSTSRSGELRVFFRLIVVFVLEFYSFECSTSSFSGYLSSS